MFTQGFAAGLGIDEPVNSPTFTILQQYDGGRMPLYHFDVYRVHDPRDLFELGFEDYLNGDGICFIEWADLIEEYLPEDIFVIGLEYGEAEGERLCTLIDPYDEGPLEEE